MVSNLLLVTLKLGSGPQPPQDYRQQQTGTSKQVSMLSVTAATMTEN